MGRKGCISSYRQNGHAAIDLSQIEQFFAALGAKKLRTTLAGYG